MSRHPDDVSRNPDDGSRNLDDLPSRLTDRLEVGRTLHDVPPHVVSEAEFDGHRAIYKASTGARGSAGIEGRVLRSVDRETSIPVPEVLAVGSSWFVADYREEAPADVPDDEKRLEAAWLRVAGRTLGRLHEESAFDRHGLLEVDGNPADPEAGLRVDAHEDATWSAALDDLLEVYQRSIDGTGYAGAVADAREFLAAYAERFDRDRPDPVLLHGWFTPDHVTVVDDEPSCVIDFEHALVGSAEWDYWRSAVALFVGENWERPADAEAQFREGYESVRSLPNGLEERATAYRAFVAVSYLDSLHTQHGIDDENRELADAFSARSSAIFDDLRAVWG